MNTIIDNKSGRLALIYEGQYGLLTVLFDIKPFGYGVFQIVLTGLHGQSKACVLLNAFSVQHKRPVLACAPQSHLVVVMGAHEIP